MPLAHAPAHIIARKSSGESPASFAMPPIVKALMGFARGITTRRRPSLITIWPLCRTTRKPSFCRTRTASLCPMPGSLGTAGNQTVTNSRENFTPSAASAASSSSAATSCQSAIASRMFASASLRVWPWLQHPGSAGQRTAKPSSLSINSTGKVMERVIARRPAACKPQSPAGSPPCQGEREKTPVENFHQLRPLTLARWFGEGLRALIGASISAGCLATGSENPPHSPPSPAKNAAPRAASAQAAPASLRPPCPPAPFAENSPWRFR